ncbi:hypothetical protein BD779DRAFT_1500438, partial [Infundibulicybe gibba]
TLLPAVARTSPSRPQKSWPRPLPGARSPMPTFAALPQQQRVQELYNQSHAPLPAPPRPPTPVPQDPPRQRDSPVQHPHRPRQALLQKKSSQKSSNPQPPKTAPPRPRRRQDHLARRGKSVQLARAGTTTGKAVSPCSAMHPHSIPTPPPGASQTTSHCRRRPRAPSQTTSLTSPLKPPTPATPSGNTPPNTPTSPKTRLSPPPYYQEPTGHPSSPSPSSRLPGRRRPISRPRLSPRLVPAPR